MKEFIRLIILIIMLKSCEGDIGVLPVFLLDFDKSLDHMKIEPNPFSKITTDFFVDILQDAIKNSKVIINFIEDTLCSEDLSSKDIKGSPFSNLRAGLLQDQVRYFPTVQDPYKIIRQVFELHNLNVFHMDNLRTNMKMYDTKYSHLYVYFLNEHNETRIEMLRKHDIVMREVYFTMRNHYPAPVLAFYTGKTNPIVIKSLKSIPLKRNVISQDSAVTVESRDALFRFVGVYSSSASRQARFSQIPVVSEEKVTRRRLSTRVAYTDFDLQFNFSFKKDGWLIDDVALLEGGEEVGRSNMGVGAPWDWSLVCGEPLVIINTRDGSAVTISHYQIQPFRRRGRSYGEDWPSVLVDDDAPAPPDPAPPAPEPAPPAPEAPAPAPAAPEAPTGDGTDGPKTFGKSVHCGPYFNSAILGALFVTFICLGILFVAVGAIYNCNSNNRYDDAQGKPLVIATEGSH